MCILLHSCKCSEFEDFLRFGWASSAKGCGPETSTSGWEAFLEHWNTPWNTLHLSLTFLSSVGISNSVYKMLQVNVLSVIIQDVLEEC